MSPESVDSTKKKPSNRSQPQISAKFPRLGTRFPKRPEPNTGKHARRRRARAPHDKICAPRKRPSLNRFTAGSHHPNFNGEIGSSAVATQGPFALRGQQALFHSRRRPRQIGAVSPLATSQPYFALAASHAAEASRAQASISASWSRLSTFCRPPPCPASCASIMAPTQPSISR